jgi:hypothetical protein
MAYNAVAEGFINYKTERTPKHWLTLIIPVSDRDFTKFMGELITWG